MRRIIVFFVCAFVFIFIPMFFSRPVFATKYYLIAPSGTLQRGTEIKFTITIDTEGQAVANPLIGMTYKSDALQYISIVPGNTYTNISITPDASNNLVISGSSDTPFTGSGDLAYVTFKIIATAPGSTDLCVLFAPTTTPTPGVTSSAPQPTALPKTGETSSGTKSLAFGIGFLILTGVLFVLNRKESHVKIPHHTKGS